MATQTMTSDKRRNMGRFSVEFEIANHQDTIGVALGVLSADQVRRASVSGVVDTGATRLVLPASVVGAMGFPETGEVTVQFADGRTSSRKVVGEVELQIANRSGVFSAIVEPGRTDALIGAIVLEELDLLPDCVAQRLVPRDPRGILAEIE